MKLKATTIAMILAAALCANSFGKDKPKEDVVKLQGAVVDVHSETRSHEWMIKRGVQDATDEKSCTLHCVKDMGGSYVLVVKKDVYRLDDQVKSELFAGKNVKVSGTLDPKTNTVHVYEMVEDK